MYTVVVVYGSYTLGYNCHISMDVSVRMHSTSHLDYGLIVISLYARGMYLNLSRIYRIAGGN